MADEHSAAVPPAISIVIPVYDDWVPLDRCLRSLEGQRGAPSFEVVVVDDGSRDAVPAAMRDRARIFPLTVIREGHEGIAAARNRGIGASAGSLLVFVDADCRLRFDCLAKLAEAVARAQEQNCFQLHLTGDCSTLVGRAEHLRLLAIQCHQLQAGNRIRYLNTAGFAIRRAKAQVPEGLFHPAAPRGEDTLLLTTLIEGGELPSFVSEAIVEHAIHLSLRQCFRKDLRTVLLEAKAYELIASKGIGIRVSHFERLRILRAMWQISRSRTIGRLAWLVVTARQAWQRAISVACRFCFRLCCEPVG